MARHLDVAFDAVHVSTGETRRVHFIVEVPRGFQSQEEIVAAAVAEQTPPDHEVIAKTLVVKEA